MENQNQEDEYSCQCSTDKRNELAERIAAALNQYSAKPLILGVLSDYEIKKAEKGLVVYNGGETEYLIKRFLISKKVQGCTNRTIKTYGQCLRFAFSKIGKKPTDVTHVDVQALIAYMITKGDSKAYQSLNHRTLSSFYKWAVREEIVLRNPMLKVDSIKMKAPKKYAFSAMEVEQIRAACKDNREKAIVEVLLSTGCRAFEAAGLTREQAANDEIEIIGKGEKPRVVYINAKARLAIDMYLSERKDTNKWLFPASIMAGQSVTQTGSKSVRLFKGKSDWYKNPKLVDPSEHQQPDGLRSVVHHIGKRANVDDCHPHRFRRTCATMALQRGMPVTMVQLMLGHDSLETTQRYLDIRGDELKEAHKKFVI